MSLDGRPPEHAQPVTHRQELLELFTRAFKPASAHRVGLEHELTGFATDGSPVPYDGPAGIERLLRAFARFGYEPFEEQGRAIAMLQGSRQISLEPGGQVEHSGSPFTSALEVAREHEIFLARLRAIAAERGLRFASLGYRPVGTPQTAAWMPKARYRVLREYLSAAGRLGLDMMTHTATAQVSVDFSSEADLASKVAAAVSVSPLVSALCANSPVVDGKPSGYASYRCRVWEDVDPRRCGLVLFEGPFTIEKYVDWALGAPMIFIRRDGRYVHPAGLTFGAFLDRGFEGHRATQVDWTDHLSTLFPDVRVKNLIELRSADAAGSAHAAALVALWKGALYDPDSRQAVTDLCARLSSAERVELRTQVARDGLKARVPKLEVAPACRDLVEAARRGLSRLGAGEEGPLLAAFEETLDRGDSPARSTLEAWTRDGLSGVIAATRV